MATKILYLFGSLILAGSAIQSDNGLLFWAAVCFITGTMLSFKEYE